MEAINAASGEVDKNIAYSMRNRTPAQTDTG
jgi:hypothetical protein